MVASGFSWSCDHVKVGRWIGIDYTLCQPVSEYLVKPLANLAGGVQRSSRLDFAYQFYQLRSRNRFYGAIADNWDQIIVEVELRLVCGAFRPPRSVISEPLSSKRLESYASTLCACLEAFFCSSGSMPSISN